jgi:hypothetical protein
MFRSQRLHSGNGEIDYQFFEQAKITHLESRLAGKKASHHLRELKVSTTLKVKTSAVISTSRKQRTASIDPYWGSWNTDSDGKNGTGSTGISGLRGRSRS